MDKKIIIGVLRELHKRGLLTKTQLDRAIELVNKKEAEKRESDAGGGVLPG